MFDRRYTVFRKDRKSRGGGVLLAVQAKSFCAGQRLHILETEGENLWVKLTFRRSTIFVCVVYFPPNTHRDLFLEFYEKLENSADIIKGKNVIIFGDFNLPSNVYPKNEHLYFLNLFNLRQINDVVNVNGRCLDQIYTNMDAGFVTLKRHESPLVIEDDHHPALDLNVSLYSSKHRFNNNFDMNVKANETGWKFSYSKIDIFRRVVRATDWSALYDYTCVDDAVMCFYNILYNVFDECFAPGDADICAEFPSWFSRSLIRLIKKKHFVHKLWKHTKSRLAYEKFSDLRKLVKKELQGCYKQFLNRTEANICSDPSQFWNYIASRKVSSEYPEHMSLNGNRFSDPQDISNAFSDYFSSVYNQIAPDLDISYGDISATGDFCNDLGISFSELDYSFRKLKSKRSSGPDQIPAYLLKNSSTEFRDIFHFLFNLSIKSGIFPTLWKTTKVIPIHKKGDKSDIENYRPVAIISTPAKLMEIILHKRLWDSVSHLIIDEQHGFRPTRSIVTNLLCFNTFVEKRLDERSQVDVVYTDFQKAFDKVDHDILLRKLNDVGLCNRLILYLASYLYKRQQYISYCGHDSECFYTYSGVPQGSNLGPLLFTLFINDIYKHINNAKFLLYADDLKLFREITCLGDTELLQRDIDSLVDWSDLNKLKFSAPKCHIMTYTKKRNPIRCDYSMENSKLERVLEVKDLGITYVENFSFHKHIEITVDKAVRMLGFIIRSTSNFENAKTIKLLYDSLVRSILESGSIIWSPYEATYILKLERVQKKFARFYYKLTYGYYPYLFPSLFVNGCLDMSTLQKRRKEYLVRHFFKVLRGIISNPDILQLLQLYVPDCYGRSRRHNLFYCPSGRTNIVAHSPINTACQLLNDMSEQIDIFNVEYNEFKDAIYFIIK
jgi:hypothetical protein